MAIANWLLLSTIMMKVADLHVYVQNSLGKDSKSGQETGDEGQYLVQRKIY
jgi:hypothetical protein